MPITVACAVTPRQGVGDASSTPAHVVMVHRLTQDDIAVGVEAGGQFLAVVAQVGLDGVSPAIQRVTLVLYGRARNVPRTRRRCDK